MADANPLSFIFGGNTGMSYQELLRRRAVATAQASRQRGFPKTFGEGLTYLGESVGDRLESNRLSEAERLQSAKEDAIRGGSPVGGGYVPGGAGPAAAAPAPVLDAGSPDPLAGRARIAMALNGTPPEVASPDPTVGAETPLGSPSAEEARWRARTSAPDDAWSARENAIGGIESSNNYRTVGVPTEYGRAMGRYGVIEANVGPWTQEALGVAMTPQQFLANDKAQDAVFRHRFGQYVAKYGEENAARAWYGGEGNINNLGARDQHERLTVHDYGKDYLNRLRGKRADAGDGADAPVQLAALGGPSGTMSDAPPPGTGNAPALPPPLTPQQLQQPDAPWKLQPSPIQPPTPPPPQAPPPGSGLLPADPDQPNPDQPTVTADIRPMSVRTQIAQAPAGLIPGATAGLPGVAMGPNQPPLPAPPGAPAVDTSQGIRPAPNAPPSALPMPVASEQEMAHEGPEPKRPGPLPPSKQQQYWQRFIDSPNVSEETRAHALRMYNAEEIYRKEISAAQQNDYVDKREAWQATKLAREKFDREANDRRIKQSIDLHGLEKTRIDIAKGYFEAGKPRQQALDKADLEIAEARQRIEKGKQELAAGKAPGHITHEGQLLVWDQESGTFKVKTPETATSAEGRPLVKLTETQAKTFDNLQKAELAFEQYKRIRDADQVLAQGLQDELAGKIPFFGNAALTSRYRRARNAALNVVTAHLRETSGAVIAPSEEASHILAIFPKYGDDPAIVRQKSQMQENIVNSMRLKLGNAAELADYASRKRREGDAAEQAKIRDEMKSVGTPEIGKVYKEGNKRRYWTGSRWEDD